MDNEVGIITDIVDLSSTGSQAEALLGQLKRIDDAMNILSSKSISLGGVSSSKEITAQIKALQSELANLQKQKQEILTSDIAAAKLEQAQANAKLAQIRLLAEEEKKAADIRKKNAADDIILNKMIAEEEREIARQRIVSTQEQAKADEEAAQHRRDLAANEFERLSLQPGAPALGQQQIPQQQAIVVPVAPLTSIEQTAAALNEEKAALVALQAEQKQLNVDFEAGAITAAQYEKELARLTVAQVECKQTIAGFNLELNNLVKSSSAAVGSIEEQRAELALLNQQYIALGVAEQESVGGVALQQKIAATTESLKVQEAELGQAQRNVGNYGSGFEKVGKQLDKFTNVSTIAATTLSRLFRTFIGFAVISVVIDLFRNLGGAIGDAIEKVRAPLGSLNDTLKKNQEAVAGAQQAYTSAVQAVDNLKEHIRLSKEGFIDQDKVVKEYNDTMGKTVGASNSLADVEQKLISQGDNYIKFTLYKAAATVALGKAADQAFLAEQARQKQAQEFASAGTAAKGGVTAFDDLGQAAPGAAQATIKRQEQAAEEAKQRAIKEAEDQEAALEKIAKDFNDKAKGFGLNFLPDPDAKGVKEATEKIKNFFAKTSDEILKHEIEIETQLSQAQELGFATRLAFAKDAYEKQNFLDAKDRQEKIAAARLKLNDALQAANETAAISTKGLSNTQSQAYKNAIEKQSVAAGNAQREFNATITTINDAFRQHEIVETDKYYGTLQLIRGENEQKRRDEEKRDRDLAEGFFKEEQEARLKLLNDKNETSQSGLKEERDRQLAALEKARVFDIANKDKQAQADQDYNHKKLKIEADYLRSSLNQNIRYIEELLEIRKAQTATTPQEQVEKDQQIKAFEAQIAALKKQLAESQAGQRSDDVKKTKEDYAELVRTFQQIQDIAGRISDIIGGAINAYITAQKNALQDQSDAIDANSKKELDAIANSTASEQDKAAKVAIINARAQAQKEQVALRQRQLDQQKAAFDKAANIANIITRTALAVVSALPDIPLAVIAGVLGAAELAVAIATPIPRYKHGIYEKDKHPGGPAIVGDGGRPEYVLLPNGEGFVTPARDTMVNLPRGAQVFPDANNLPAQLMRMAMRPMRQLPAYDHTGAMVNAMAREIQGLKRAVMGRPYHGTHIKDGELRRFVRKDNGYTEYLNRNT